MRLHIDGLANARDLGGLERANHAVTPSGVFVRADHLDGLTSTGWQQLRDHGIRTVIDLRRPHERGSAAPSDFDHVQLDLDGDNPTFWEARQANGTWGTPLYYLDHLRDLPQHLAAVLQAIATAQAGGVLFHCAAGWDRTGLVAAVLQRAVGVTTAAATTDYEASFANAERLATLHRAPSEAAARIQILRKYGHTPASAFQEMFRGLDLNVWFDRADLDATTRHAVRTWRGSITDLP